MIGLTIGKRKKPVDKQLQCIYTVSELQLKFNKYSYHANWGEYESMTTHDDNKTEFDGYAVPDKVKFEIYGEEMIQKTVKSSGNSGRIYLPPEWIGKKVKVIKC